MRKLFDFGIIIGVLAVGSVAPAQFINLQDFESGTSGNNLPGAWAPSFSGTSTGNYEEGSSVAQFSDEQANEGSLSGKLSWKWLEVSTNAPKRIRIQPAAGWISGSNNAVDHTSTPFVGFYLYGAAQGDQVALYMGEGNNGAGPYEQFAPMEINWNGWAIYEKNILTDPVVALFTGDGTLPATCSASGLMFFPPVANPATSEVVTYYVDDFGFSETARNESSVGNWSVY